MTITERTFTVPTRAEVSANNQGLFDNLQKGIGFVPNLYAYFAKNETALEDYLSLQGRKSTLKSKEREIINLVTSQINNCLYCQAAHTVIGKLSGFSEEQILEIRKGSATFDSQLDALIQFTASTVQNRGKATIKSIETFLNAGYNEANLIDVIMVIGDKIIMNYLHNLTGLEIDFPLAENL